MEYHLIEIPADDRLMQRKLDALLEACGLRRDARLDYSAGIVDEDYRLLATGSCAQNTLRCIAVDPRYRGEGLLNSVITRLTEVQAERGNDHIFVYTKTESAPFFSSIAYKEIARSGSDLVFMENKANGFSRYLEGLGQARSQASCAIVMNANPFTLGHRHLVSQAAREGFVHVFVVAEDVSEIPFELRYRMVSEGCADLSNVTVHSTDAYMISSATFPAYFLPENDTVTEIQARLDAEIFSRIAARLNIKKRFFGTEPLSRTTEIYNQVMARTLPEKGIEAKIIPRLELSGQAVSASTVRAAIHRGDTQLLNTLLPQSTVRLLQLRK